MRTNNFRRGNIIDGGIIAEIHSGMIRLEDDTIKLEDEIEGIPLTEDILLKLGFEFCGYDLWFAEQNDFCITVMPDDITYGYKHFNFRNSQELTKGISLKHVHTLQNLYYALTNQELTLKQ